MRTGSIRTDFVKETSFRCVSSIVQTAGRGAIEYTMIGIKEKVSGINFSLKYAFCRIRKTVGFDIQ